MEKSVAEKEGSKGKRLDKLKQRKIQWERTLSTEFDEKHPSSQKKNDEKQRGKENTKGETEGNHGP